ncbi:MAG: hypothetical protein QM493_04055 [Sulfurovum sp.]
MMKNIYAITIFFIGSLAYADCDTIPNETSVIKAIKAKQYDKAKSLLDTLKLDIKIYLKSCDKSKKMFEQTHVTLLTCEAKLSDLEADIKKDSHGVDCSKVPSSSKVVEAINASDSANIEAMYKKYKKDASNYIEHCASHPEYATVYDEVMFCDEMYDEWKQ